MEEKDGSDRCRRKEELAVAAHLREDLCHQREENKHLVELMTSSLYDKTVVFALANSYEDELERLRAQIVMMKDNYIANQISDAWLKNELDQMERSVPSLSHSVDKASNPLGAAAFSVADTIGLDGTA
ncbi:hypothetical protein DQ04_12741030, partial [Trypanosoma grayi]|uniref:hypothetical protein n=1 Tax=Trypanosoma grayi TaxID=71804 RepID=UPI0004F47D24